MTVEDRRQAVAELAEAGESQRSIAGVLGVDQATVNRDLADANASTDDDDATQDESSSDAFASNPLDAVATLAANEMVRTAYDMVAAHEATKRAGIELQDDDDSAVDPLPPQARLSHGQQAEIFYEALRNLSRVGADAKQLRSALPDYQHFRIAEWIGHSIELLQEVEKEWIAKQSNSNTRKRSQAAANKAETLS